MYIYALYDYILYIYVCVYIYIYIFYRYILDVCIYTLLKENLPQWL